MSSKFRNLIGAKSRQVLSTAFANVGELPSSRRLVQQMKLTLNKKSAQQPISVTLPGASLGLSSDSLPKFIENFETDSSVTSVFCRPDDDADNATLTFDVNRNEFISRELATQLRHERQGYVWLRDGLFPEETPMKVVVSGTGRNLPSKKNNPVNEIPVTLESQTRFKIWPLSYFRNECGKNDLATKKNKLGHFSIYEGFAIQNLKIVHIELLGDIICSQNALV